MKLDNLRRINLDFHTSEHIENIGCNFSKDNFKEALVEGHITSITLFAKCHHGYTYFPSKVCSMHPNLKFNLLKEEIDAAHEIGVQTPIYIPIGWSEKDANDHPEWMARDFVTKEPMYYRFDPNAKPSDVKPMVSWHTLCPNSGYHDLYVALTKEICETFNPVDGMFFDICFIGDACGCPSCLDGMKKRGYDINSLEDGKKYYIEKRKEFIGELYQIVKGYNKDATVFFNGGAEVGYPMYHEFQTHYELEDLPTTWGGYDRLPIRAKFFTQKYSKQTIGMTGKFHTSWGEFGGYKKPDALKYECANMISLGAGCSVGDQMHPTGEMDIETYKIIGKAYSYIEKIEDYCKDVNTVSKLGLILSLDTNENEGVSKMLTERQRNFILVFDDLDLSNIDTIIVPNNPDIDDKLYNKLKDYYLNGGKLILIGDSIKRIDFCGIEYIEQSKYDIDYIHSRIDLMNLGNSPLLAYNSATVCKCDDTYSIIADVVEPYFSRTYEKYCSHKNTPFKKEYANYPAAIINERVAYIAHDIPKMYYYYGSSYHRDYFNNILKMIFKGDYAEVEGLMTCGRMIFTGNDDHYSLHMFYAAPVTRGEACVIEDLPDIYNVRVSLRDIGNITSIKKVPQMEDIPYNISDNLVTFTVDKFSNHQLIVISREKK